MSRFSEGRQVGSGDHSGVLYHPDVWDGSQDLYGILRWSEDEDKNEILKKIYIQLSDQFDRCGKM